VDAEVAAIAAAPLQPPTPPASLHVSAPDDAPGSAGGVEQDADADAPSPRELAGRSESIHVDAVAVELSPGVEDVAPAPPLAAARASGSADSSEGVDGAPASNSHSEPAPSAPALADDDTPDAVPVGRTLSARLPSPVRTAPDADEGAAVADGDIPVGRSVSQLLPATATAPADEVDDDAAADAGASVADESHPTSASSVPPLGVVVDDAPAGAAVSTGPSEVTEEEGAAAQASDDAGGDAGVAEVVEEAVVAEDEEDAPQQQVVVRLQHADIPPASAASRIFVAGNFDAWMGRYQLHPAGDGTLAATLWLSRGEHRVKFVTEEGAWFAAASLASNTDESGNVNNVVCVGVGGAGGR
jgi:hypothetical protein